MPDAARLFVGDVCRFIFGIMQAGQDGDAPYMLNTLKIISAACAFTGRLAPLMPRFYPSLYRRAAS